MPGWTLGSAGRWARPPLARTALVALLAPTAVSVASVQPAGEQLLERTLALVGGTVVTQADVALALRLGLVGDDATTPDAALAALVDRWLMLQEVARFAPAEPASSAVEARLATLRSRVSEPGLLATQLEGAGRAPSYLETWVRDELRIAAYLDQRFASAGAPAEADLASYIEAHRGALEAEGVAPADVATVARTRLVEQRRRELIADWLAELRRRTPVVTFPPD